MLINIGPGNATRLNSIPSCSALPFLNLPLPSLPLHSLACTFDFLLSYFNFQLPIPLPVKNQFDSKLRSVMSFLFSIRWQRLIPLSLSISLWSALLSTRAFFAALYLVTKRLCRCKRCTVRCMWFTPPTSIACHLLNIHKSFHVITHYPYPLPLGVCASLPAPDSSSILFICCCCCFDFSSSTSSCSVLVFLSAFALSPDPAHIALHARCFAFWFRSYRTRAIFSL